jgi:hypothetical protein
VQHVHQGVTHLARRAERPPVMPVGPDSPAFADDSIDRFRDADRETLEAAPKRGGTVGFDEQMHVVGLDAVVKQAEPFLRRAGERGSHRLEDVAAAK